MASPLYDEILEDLYNDIHEKLERRDVTDLRFAKAGTAETVLSTSNLKRLFCSLVPPGDSLERHFGPFTTAEVLASQTEKKKLQDFLAVLIYARCSIESARGFTTQLLTSSPEYTGFGQLPASRSQLAQVFSIENGRDINSFMDLQPCFCPIVLYKGEDVQVAKGRSQRLPYMSDEERIGEGSFGVVYRTVIAPGHLKDRHDLSMANTEPMPMARKDFKKVRHIPEEWETMKHILNAPLKSKNILETFGILQLDNTFSIFMPLAECDLRAWMSKNPPKRDSESWKADILKCTSGVARGLDFLHSGIRDPNGNRMICYHMDLKPANILVFPDDREPEKMIWKISDFSISRVKLSHQHHPRDISAPFKQRKGGTSASGTGNQHGGGSYLAPESETGRSDMNQKSDVWSLGCVISVIITYLSEGQLGIDKYLEKRVTTSGKSGGAGHDFFFRHIRNATQHKSHPAIRNHHKYLINEAAGRSPDEGTILRRLLEYIEHSVLQLEPERRESARSVQDELHIAAMGYQELTKKNDGSDNSIPDTPSTNTITRLKQIFHRKKPDEPVMESLFISDAKDVAGCSIASSEFTMAHWTSSHIFLYNSLSFPPYPRISIKNIAECGLKGSLVWKSVKLSGTYLIASTTGHHSHIYLFDLIGGKRPALNFDSGYEIVLPLESSNGLHRIAISPGGIVLACVAHRDAESSWVFHARIEDLISHSTQRRVSEATSSSSDESQRIVIAEGPWNHYQVETPATNVTHLSFPSDTTICYVAEPDIAETHDIKVSCKSLLTGGSITQKIENPNSSSLVFDSGNSGRLFTTFAAIDQERTFAIVLYDKELFIQNFDDTNPIFQTQEASLGNHCIVQLLMDEQHSRLFALGTKSGNDVMLLMELPLHDLKHKARPRVIKVLADIRLGDKFTARLFKGTDPTIEGPPPGESSRTNMRNTSGGDGGDGGDGGYIIISCYGAARPTLYKVCLPSPI